MRLAGRRWRTSVSAARLGGETYRVVRPARPIAHGVLHDCRFGPVMAVDKAATVDLAFAWWLAARSPRSLVYLPLRANPFTCQDNASDDGRKLDLVLLHHSLQFPVSRWKQVRARLSPAATHTVEMPAGAFRSFDRADHERTYHREFHDHLRWSVAADTLFLVGSRPAFELAGEQLRALAEDGPAEVVAWPDSYCCAEIGVGQGNGLHRHERNPPARLHIDRCHEHWPAPVRAPRKSTRAAAR
ncbi:hypothetical protein AB0I60_19555 [Actinosynnema sp. NPDC050436]|uniref:hypothetical protein n=1 Tax=Actinosynnema sp. NPDC050436 TaxID=3155659 RepID=UPI0033DAA748